MSYTGEPSAYEYAEAIARVDQMDSTDGISVHHNNLGWVGVYLTTPKGNKYIAYRPDIWGDAYKLCNRNMDCGIGWGQIGSAVSKELFENLDAVKKYVIKEGL